MSKRARSSSQVSHIYQKLFFVVVLGVVMAGCQRKVVPPTPPSGVQIQAEPTAPAKEGYTTLSGIVVKTGKTFVVIDELDKQHDIDSYSVDFNSFIDTEVKVTGQYSGDTLFVSEIEPIPTPTY